MLPVDVNQHVVDTINRGEIHIVEPDLDAMVKKPIKLTMNINNSAPLVYKK